MVSSAANLVKGKKFSDVIDMFKLYVHFVNHYERYLKIYGELMETKKFLMFEKEAATKAGVSTLVDILITPVQRLPRYQLFLEVSDSESSWWLSRKS